MAYPFNKFNPFVQNLANGKYNFATDQLAVALTNVAPSSANVKLADLTQISYTNLSSRNITTTSSTQTGGTEKVVLQNLTLSASGTVATFQYAVVYDVNATNFELIGWYDYTTPVVMGSGDNFAINFDAVNGFIQIA